MARFMTVKLGIIGADGRMGSAVDHLAKDVLGDVEIFARVSAEHPDLSALGACDMVVDFSAPEALLAALPYLSDGTALVSGTTGLTAEQDGAVEDQAARLRILRSGNFSLGINLLLGLAEQAAAALGEGWDIDILEQHHRDKVDAPSGTALMLGRAVARGRGVDLDQVAAHDRNGARRAGDIGFAVMRGGGVYGMHQVRLVSASEDITLGHVALNRDVFARGALQAAGWLQGQEAGLYSMTDMLGL